MTWLSIIGSIFHYASLPFAILFSWFLIALSPVLHLGHYLAAACLVPLRLLAKLETLYVFLGVAAVIGLLTGVTLYISSSVLVSIFNLTPDPEEKGHSAASFRAAREKKKKQQQQLEQEWQNSILKNEDSTWKSDGSMEKYAEWLEKGRGHRREDGLLGQTILEEDDDSDIF